MAVPKFFDFFTPVLKILEETSPINAKSLQTKVADVMQLSETDMAEMLPSGRQATYKNRIHWAIAYLKNAGLIKNTGRGIYEITSLGHECLLKDGDKIDLKYLESFDSFKTFHASKSPEKEENLKTDTEIDEITPLESMEKAYHQIRDELAKTLLETIMDCTPDFFERLVIDLLMAMGYGYDSKKAGMVVGRTGDGGIDGIINEDKLGFSQVYVQAKRWASEQTVSRPDVQAFVGALVGKGATKGLYITTGQFSKAARQYVQDQKATRVVLVDGPELTRLMIDNGVGVSVHQTFSVMQMDSDYFDN